ncbi:rRNA-processing protein las1 [Mortierella sp. NVP41]|nr:rRNA-processing protein las1 [Mortierella sp. NVP41]
MPPKLPKLVPWHSPAEFIQVHQWFYPPPTEDGSPDIRAQECALRRVKAWEARGKLPHAIDSTAAFMQVVVRDWTQTCSDQDLRLMYSMVFIRFVNGYVDAFQSAKSAKSIAYLAVEKVGMPIWFVELRHTATHDYLPSLAILRSATNQALAWINDNYWMPQLVSVKLDETLSPEMLTAMSDYVGTVIGSHRAEKERQLEENTLSQPKQEAHIVGRLVRDLIKRCRSGDELLNVLIPILLEPGMLVPNSKKMRASGRDLSLDSLGRMVDLCWMPLLNKVHADLRGTNNKDGDPISFWVGLVDAMLQKLIDANNAARAATLPTATAAEKSAAKTGSYLITILAWLKYLIKLHYDQQHSTVRTKLGSLSSLSSGTGSPSFAALSVASPNTSAPTSRPSVAAMAAQLVAEQAAANQPTPMFDNDDIINIVEDCLQSSLIHVSPLIRSVLNTVIECDADIKEKIGPLLRQIDQRIVSGTQVAPVQAPPPPVVAAAPSPSASATSTIVTVGRSVWHEGSTTEDGIAPTTTTESQSEDTEMADQESITTGMHEAEVDQPTEDRPHIASGNVRCKCEGVIHNQDNLQRQSPLLFKTPGLLPEFVAVVLPNQRSVLLDPLSTFRTLHEASLFEMVGAHPTELLEVLEEIQPAGEVLCMTWAPIGEIRVVPRTARERHPEAVGELVFIDVVPDISDRRSSHLGRSQKLRDGILADGFGFQLSHRNWYNSVS